MTTEPIIIQPPLTMDKEPVVIKRNGDIETVDVEKITRRLTLLKKDVESFLGRTLHVSIFRIARNCILKIYDGITTSELDEVAASECAFNTDHPDYADFGGHILMSNLEANNRQHLSFAAVCERAYNYVELKTGLVNHLISDELYAIAGKYGHLIDRRMDLKRNYRFDYFAFQTLAKGDYLRCHHRTVQRNRVKLVEKIPFETPQHMYMRVALGIYGDDLASAFELYDQMSLHYGTMATPTLFNSGTPHPQMSSCFLLQNKEDSIEGIYDTIKECAVISKHAGGIGVNIHDVRASQSYIRGSNGTSNGIVPMLKVFNCTAKYVDQGGGKRKGSFAIYLEPWHADIRDFLEMKLPNGSEEARARDLFYALWVPDLFWRRLKLAYEMDVEVEAKSPVLWSLMCPHVCPGLSDVWGTKFEALYEKYEQEEKFVRQIPIKKLFLAITTAQIETGTPYILNKDHCNRKSNQQNIGTIKSSNLCSEVIQVSTPDQTAVCNLASLSLTAFVNRTTGEFDHVACANSTRIFTKALNRVIDRNYYPVETARRSNMRHRPVGLGVSGLANAFVLMRIKFGGPESKRVNRQIAETMYFAAMTESQRLTEELDPETRKPVGAYPSMFDNGGAPIAHGKFQFDLWEDDFRHTADPDGWKPDARLGYDWETLREKCKAGVRNSLLIARMPTASTSQIIGNVEMFEPYYGMIFSRMTKAGEFPQMCRYLVDDLIALGLWKTEVHPEKGHSYIPMKNKILAGNGSIQKIDEIPQEIKDIYVTAFDIKLNDLMEMSRDRMVFTCQSESFNVNTKNSDNMKKKMLQYYLRAWELGLKTSSYYFRTLQEKVTAKFVADQDCLACGT